MLNIGSGAYALMERRLFIRVKVPSNVGNSLVRNFLVGFLVRQML
jgi:hypothetical protein